MTFKLEDYKVGWITALPIEAAAAKAMLDTIHPRLSTPEYDSNIYTFGYINPDYGISNGGHIVVIASGRPGTATAATVANDMRRTFPWLRIGLMVGIAGGVWSPDTDVRLGDIVVGVHPSGEAGVIQYDYGKQIQDKEFLKTTAMNKAPAILLNAVAAVQAEHVGLKPPEMAYVSHLDREQARRFSKRPIQDRLFNATYLHQAGSCDKCDERQLCDRPLRNYPTIPQVHYGPIASGNRVIRDAVFAEEVRMKYGNLCFEMEAAGLDNFPSLAIRGISDYCDTHKNDEWHQYAAIAAAAYAKELLSVVPPTAIVQLPQVGNTYWNVPHAPNPLFTGRESLLEDMKKHLVTGPQKNDRPVFVLQGIGGAGKSEVAAKFATENQDNFWGIFWIDADNKQSIEQGFAEIAKMQTPPLRDTTSKAVLRWLANVKESWLLILDNCDDAMMDFATYMPSRRGSIILTTRLTDCKVLGTWANLDDLGRETATQLLLRTCGYESGNQEAHIPAAEAVVSCLGQHALALVHAGAYIKKGLCTLDEYVRFFRKEQARLIKFKPKQQASRYGSVYATFEVSAKALASSQTHDSHLALQLLDILAFLDREAVDESTFKRAFKECHKLESDLGVTWTEYGMQAYQHCSVSSIGDHVLARKDNMSHSSSDAKIFCGWHGRYYRIIGNGTQNFASPGPCDSTRISDRDPRPKYPNQLNESLDVNVHELLGPGNDASGDDNHEFNNSDNNHYSELEHIGIWHCEQVRSSGLVERETVGKLRIARARLADLSLIRVDDNTISMHPVVHEWARNRLNKTARQHSWEQTVSLLALSALDDQAHSFTPRLLPHIDACFRNRGEKTSQPRLSLHAAQALYRLAWQFLHDGEFQTSLAVFETLSVSYEVQANTWSPETNALLFARAWCLKKLGRHEEARSCSNYVAQSETQKYGWGSIKTLNCQLSLAVSQHEAGDFTGALESLQSLHSHYSQVVELDDFELDDLFEILARVHKDLGNTEQAVVFLTKKLKAREQAFPLDTPLRVEALTSLCDLYIDIGQPDRGVIMLEDIINLHFTSSSRDLWWFKPMETLARAYIKLGRPDQAMPYLAKAYSSMPRDDDHHVLRSDLMRRLAGIYLDLGAFNQAAVLLDDIIEIQTSCLSLHDSRRLISMVELAATYLALGKSVMAMNLLEEMVITKTSSISEIDSSRLMTLYREVPAYMVVESDQNTKEAVLLLGEIITKCRRSMHSGIKAPDLYRTTPYEAQERSQLTTNGQRLIVEFREIQKQNIRQEAASKRSATTLTDNDTFASQDSFLCSDENKLAKRRKP